MSSSSVATLTSTILYPPQRMDLLPATTLSTFLSPQRCAAGIAREPNTARDLKPAAGVPRLLYRGALSLPDSYILLDGLAFTINIPTDDPQASLKLLETPLALALESMRGRPSLSFVGIEKMDEVHCDFTDGVSVYVHPKCTLTQQLFTCNLCAGPIVSSTGRTAVGVRVRLGDTDYAHDAPTANDVIIYGRPHPSTSTMQLCVARILPHSMPPPSTHLPKVVMDLRPPRPDDPTPRRPPLLAFNTVAGTKRSLESVNGKDGKKLNDAGKKKLKKTLEVPHPRMGTAKVPSSSSTRVKPTAVASIMLSRELGKRSRVDAKRSDEAIFKLPALPASCLKDARIVCDLTQNDDDPFLDHTDDGSQHVDITAMETANKLFLKKATVRLLAKSGMSKQNHEFKELFGYIYRGASFALRAKLKDSDMQTDKKLVEKIIQLHIQLYVHGDGRDVLDLPP